MPMLITNPRLPDNPIVFANKAFQNLTGYDSSEIIGKNCRFLQGSATNPKHVEMIRAALDTEQSIDIDILNYKKSGEPFWNRLHISPVKTDDGELHYFVSSQLDVTLSSANWSSWKRNAKRFPSKTNAAMISSNTLSMWRISVSGREITTLVKSAVQPNTDAFLD